MAGQRKAVSVLQDHLSTHSFECTNVAWWVRLDLIGQDRSKHDKSLTQCSMPRGTHFEHDQKRLERKSSIHPTQATIDCPNMFSSFPLLPVYPTCIFISRSSFPIRPVTRFAVPPHKAGMWQAIYQDQQLDTWLPGVVHDKDHERATFNAAQHLTETVTRLFHIHQLLPWIPRGQLMLVMTGW